MAQRTTVELVDDIDGSKNAETVKFSLQQTSYEIELSPKNLKALTKALQPYIEAGRKVPRASGGRRKSSALPR